MLHFTFQFDRVVKLLKIRLHQWRILLIFRFQSLTESTTCHTMGILKGIHKLPHHRTVLQGRIIEVAISINQLLLLLCKDDSLLLLIHDFLDGTSILMKVNRCLILIRQFLTHIIFLGCLIIQAIKMLLGKLIMELTFQHRSQTQSLLILQFLISLLSLIKRRILLSVNDTAILIQGF